MISAQLSCSRLPFSNQKCRLQPGLRHGHLSARTCSLIRAPRERSPRNAKEESARKEHTRVRPALTIHSEAKVSVQTLEMRGQRENFFDFRFCSS